MPRLSPAEGILRGRESFLNNDESLEHRPELSARDLIMAEIVEDLEAVLEQFRKITECSDMIGEISCER